MRIKPNRAILDAAKEADAALSARLDTLGDNPAKAELEEVLDVYGTYRGALTPVLAAFDAEVAKAEKLRMEVKAKHAAQKAEMDEALRRLAELEALEANAAG